MAQWLRISCTQAPGPRGDFHVVALGGRGERLDGVETELAQFRFGILPDEVIGVAQGRNQTLELLRRRCGAGGRLRGGKGPNLQSSEA